jgi:DNA polymerase-3 subunit delta'
MHRFNEIITHQGHLHFLQSAIDRSAMPHAVLLWGPEGTGNLATALAVAQYMVCRDKSEEGACGVCKGCVRSDKFMHPDIHFAFPTIGSKVTGDRLYPQWREAIRENPHLSRHQWLDRIDAEGKQGNINVEDINRMISLLNLHSFEADCKILIIWLPEYLGKEGNRLLKLIEEPPANSYIMLVAENREEILPTILSRCQQFYFPLLQEHVIATGLTHHLKMAADRAGWIAAAAQGDWNTALLLSEGKTLNPVKWTQDWIRTAWSKDAGTIHAWVEVAAKYSREESKQLLLYILGILQKVLWVKFGKSFPMNDDEKTTLNFLNTKIEQRELSWLASMCEENLRAIQQNANGKILWFHMTLALQKILHTENAALSTA